MKKLFQIVKAMASRGLKWMLPFLICSCISLIIFAAIMSLTLGAAQHKTLTLLFSFLPTKADKLSVEEAEGTASPSSFPDPPRFAYLIAGSKGDGARIRRTLQALYHPRNQYALHLDLEATPRERVNLNTYVKLDKTFREVGNVHLISKANLITYRGPTMIACTLQAAAVLLKKSKDWDWFINLSASDYPLMTQDDLLHVFSYLPRGLNFIDHTSDISWKEFQRARPIIIDPGLYSSRKSEIFWVSQRRAVPTAFKLFTGSAWTVLTREFVEYCIWGWDNLPRTLLMYYANFISSPEGYFHTVICNSKEFRNTTVNHDMHFIAWDTPPKQHPISLTINHFDNFTDSGAPFARKFAEDDHVLDKIDKELLGREKDSFTPGGWCIGTRDNGTDPCLVVGDPHIIKPGPGAKRLEKLILKLLAPKSFRSMQCKFQ